MISSPPPPFEAGSLTSLKRLDRLVHEHQSLADIHHLKLELQIHATMAIFFFFPNVASVA